MKGIELTRRQSIAVILAPMDASPTFALVRHGDYHQPLNVPSALLPYPLTDLGVAQARDAAISLMRYAEAADLDIELVVDSSQQLRSWQTATLIAESIAGSLGLVVRVEEYPELAERSVGAMANLTVAEIESVLSQDPRYPAPPSGWKSDSHYCLPFLGAESLLDAGARVAKHIEYRHSQLESQRQPARILKVIVGHGASIRHACAALGLLDVSAVAKISMHHATPVYISRQIDGWQKVAGEWKQRSNGGDEIRESR